MTPQDIIKNYLEQTSSKRFLTIKGMKDYVAKWGEKCL